MTLDPVLPLWFVVAATAGLGVFAIVRMLRTTGRVRIGWMLRLIMVALLMVVALRPALPGSGSGPRSTGGLEVYIAVDTTSSMAAEDVPATIDGRPATRLDAAKNDIAQIASALEGAQFSLTTFDSSAVQRVPLTSDVSALASATGALAQEITFYSSGSSIDAPLALLTELLIDAEEAEPDRERVLFYLGDGEQTRDTEPQSFDALPPFVDGGAVVAYGTAEGGRMRAFDGYSADDGETEPRYIPDPSTGADALSFADESTLAAIAEQTGLPSARSGTDDLGAVLSGIEVGATQTSPATVDGPVEFYWIFAIPLGALAVRELLSTGLALARVPPRRAR